MSAALIPAIRSRLSAELDSWAAAQKAEAEEAVKQAAQSLESLLKGLGGQTFADPVWDVTELLAEPAPDAGGLEALAIEVASSPQARSVSLLDGSISLSQISLGWALELDPIDGGVTNTQARLQGTIDFKGKFSTTATLDVPALDGTIQLALEPHYRVSDLGALAELLGVGDIASRMPTGLSALDDIELAYLRFEMEPDFKRVDRISLAIAGIESWSLVDGKITLQDLGINLILQAGDSGSISGYVLGTMVLGSARVDVAVMRFDPDGDWRLAVQSRQIPLPSLDDFSNLIGVKLDQLLPPQVAGIELTIFDLDIDVGIGERKLERAAFSLAANHPISLSPTLPDLTGFHIDTQLDWSSGQLQASSNIAGAIEIAGDPVNLLGVLDDDMELTGSLPVLPLSELAGQLLSRSSLAAELPEVELTDIEFSMVHKQGATRQAAVWGFSVAAAASCDLAALCGALGIALPESVSAIRLSRLAAWREAEDESWHLRFVSETSIPFDPGNPEGIAIKDASLELIHSKTAETTLACSFVIDGSAVLSDDLSLQAKELQFTWLQGESSWSVEGDVSADIASNSYLLQASVEVGKDSNSIALEYPEVIDLTDLDGAGEISVRDLKLFTRKQTDGGEVSHQWGVSGSAEIKVNHLFDATGTLSLQSGTDGTRLEMTAEAPRVPRIPLLPDFPNPPQLDFSLDALSIVYSTNKHGKANWSLASAVHVQIENIPDLLEQYLPPEPLEGHLRADGNKVVVGFDVPSTLQPEFPELALTFSNDYKLSLGKPEIEVTAIEIELGDEPKLVQKITAGLPSQLNNLFGFDDKGKPNLDLFNDSFELRLALAKKLSLTAATSPLKPLEFYTKDEDEGGVWTKWNFGVIGEIEFRVPEFAFRDGRWNASGGFHRLTPISLPLKPVKFLLEKSGFPTALNNAIPDAMPIKDVELHGDNFAREMKLLLGPDVLGRLDKGASALLEQLFDAMEKVIDSLPSHLQEYLEIRIPESAILEVSVDSAGGGTSVALRTLEEDPPLKFLFPMMLSLPELVGISANGFSFGQKMGGTLALVEFDGHIDRLDMASLVAALALGKKDISNRYILERTLFVVPTALPMPIPLFFNNLGLDYRDVLGFDIQARWSYPDPELGLTETITLFGDLLQFFQKGDYLLHREGFGETLNLELTIGENFIALPQYLGGQILGLKKALPTLPVGDSIARFLDFLKTGNAGYAITAIPLQHDGQWIRIGSEEIHFGPLVVGMSWCITTDDEFVKEIIPASEKNEKLPVKFDDAVLQSLPDRSGNASYGKGFIIMLMGHAAIGSIVGMRTEFGIAVTAQGGFETGFRLAGIIGNSLSLQMSGTIHADEKSLTIKGGTGLYWKDSPLIAASGDITVTDSSLSVVITIELTPQFHLTGSFAVGKQGLMMEGKAAWGHGAQGPSEGIGAKILFDQNGMAINFPWRLSELEGAVSIQVPGDGGNRLFKAIVSLEPNPALQKSFTDSIQSVARDAAENTVDKVYDDLQELGKDVKSLELSIDGLRGWVPPLCDEIIAIINRSIDDNTTTWKRPGRAPAHRIARPYIRRLAHLRDVVKNGSEQTFRTELKGALQAIVDNNHLDVSVTITLVKWKKNKWGLPYPVKHPYHISVYERDLMNKEQLSHLKEAIESVDKLKKSDGIMIEKQKLYDQLPPRDKLLAQINREVRSGVENAVPRIESLGFETSLGILNPSALTVNVNCRRAGKPQRFTATLDLTNPAAMSRQLVDAFGN